MEYDAIIRRVESDPQYDENTKAAMVALLRTLRSEEALSRLTSSKAKRARDVLRDKFGFSVSRFRPANRSV